VCLLKTEYLPLYHVFKYCTKKRLIYKQNAERNAEKQQVNNVFTVTTENLTTCEMLPCKASRNPGEYINKALTVNTKKLTLYTVLPNTASIHTYTYLRNCLPGLRSFL
jgi:hypothetical protein